MKKKAFIFLITIFCFVLTFAVLTYATEATVPPNTLTEAQVKELYDTAEGSGMNPITGLLLWAFCIVGFLKAAQKMDSTLQSLGLSVAHTGGQLLGDLFMAARSVGAVGKGLGALGSGTTGFDSSKGNSPPLQPGGLAGAIGRKIENSIQRNATGTGQGLFDSKIGKTLYESSLNGTNLSENAIGKSGDTANNAIGKIARGDVAGHISGTTASKAFRSYFDLEDSAKRANVSDPKKAIQSNTALSDPPSPSSYPVGKIETPFSMRDSGISMNSTTPTSDKEFSSPATTMFDEELNPQSTTIYSMELDTDLSPTYLSRDELPSLAEPGSIPYSAKEPVSPYTSEGTPKGSDVNNASGFSTPATISTKSTYPSVASSSPHFESIGNNDMQETNVPHNQGFSLPSSTEEYTTAGSPEFTSPLSTEPLYPQQMFSIDPIPTTETAFTESSTGTDLPTHTNEESSSSNTFAVEDNVTDCFNASPPISIPSSPEYSNIEMGGGYISGLETSQTHPEGIPFAMYDSSKYLQPQNAHEIIQSIDGNKWYKQYAVDTVNRTPYYKSEDGTKTEGKGRKIAYKEEIVKRLPPTPQKRGKP